MKFLFTVRLRQVLFLLCCLIPSLSLAQSAEWWNMMQDPQAQYEETVAAFEEYWAGRPITKGSGWKPFQRWSYYMESRVAPDGSQIAPSQTLEEFDSYVRTHLDRSRRNNLANGNWTEVGPVDLPINGTGQPNGLGRTTCLAFHPSDPNTLFVGAPAGGIWKSTDYGITWTSLNNGLTRLGVSSIVVHPTTPNTIWIGTGDRDGGDAPGYGVWKSIDGGNTWAASNTGMGNRTVNEILMDPNNSDVLIAATNNRMYRSVNGGANWTQTLTGVNLKDIIFKPGSSSCIYGSGTVVYRSLDNGMTWTQMTNGVPVGVQRMALATSAADPDRVYIFAGDGGGLEGYYLSTDSATLFTQQSTTPNICDYGVTGAGTGSQAWYDLVTMADPNDANHVISGAINVWESFDAGATWTIMTHWVGSGGNPAVHADIHVLEYSSLTGDMFIGHDGGVHQSDDAGVTWTEISDGLPIAQIYKIGQSQQNPDLTINGYQDNGTAYYRNGSWHTEIGGDGMECIIDYTADNVMYGALYYGDIRRSTNGGNSFATIAENGTNGITESGAWITPYKLHPHNPDTMFVGYRQVWRSYNCKSAATNAVTWTSISTFGGTSTVRDIAISESDPDVIYVARAGTNNFYRTTNATAATPTWTDLDGNLPAGGTPKDIEIHPTDPSIVWISMGNNIYESLDGGTSWADISGTLPNISLNTIVYDDFSPVEAMYVGMDAGVYYLDNTLADWVLYMDGLPNVEVTELEIYYDPECRGKDMLKAATYGRGLWESDLKDPGTVAPVACFEASSTEVCVGAVVTLEDFSAYNPTSWNWTVTPATYTFVNGTTAASENPEVVFNAVGSYTVRLVSTNGNGTDLFQEVGYILVGTSSAPPFAEDFETAGLCATTNDCETTSCPLPNDWINFTNGIQDDIDWRVDEGGTPTGGTGPATDLNPGTATGNYIYLEASSCFNREAILESPCIDLTSGTFAFTFGYHMSGADIASLHVDVVSNGVVVQDVIAPIVGDQGAAWNYTAVDLSLFSGQVINIRLRGYTGASWQSDIALDDLSFNSVLPAEVVSFSATLNQTGAVDLDWEVEQEVGSVTYKIERSEDGNLFVTVYEAEGLGPFENRASYSAVDANPVFGKSFYQLYSVDKTGVSHQSAVVEVFRPYPSGFEVSEPFPNPFSGETEITLTINESRQISAVLYNSLGQAVLEVVNAEFQPGAHTLTISAGDLPDGQYWLRLNSDQGEQTRILLKRN